EHEAAEDHREDDHDPDDLEHSSTLPAHFALSRLCTIKLNQPCRANRKKCCRQINVTRGATLIARSRFLSKTRRLQWR
ncbi:MAG TPA: hypothetical protein PLH23_19365, partial [Hyphomonadaceae bacterium]|nr:hypothetical protein [Hyphomonadaceae bacterium]